MTNHCSQCDTPDCLRFNECQTLNIMRIPRDVDFIIYSINGHMGGTPVANVGGFEAHGDSVQDAIDNAVVRYKKENLPPFTTMKWSDRGDRPNDNEYCACCDQFVNEESRRYVECSSDMTLAYRADMEMSDSQTGGVFCVGPVCAEKYLDGYTFINRKVGA